MGQFSGRRAIIWGGTSGINLAIAQMFAKRGASVFLVSRSADKVQAAVELVRSEGGTADGMAADVRNYAQVEEAAARAAEGGRLDMVVSGAAGNFLVPAAEMSANAFKTVIDIDLLGTFNTARACYRHFARPETDGRAACYTAITAPQAVRAIRLQAHACAAKAGINMLLQCLALEWGPEGIRVNGISPGPIADTEGVRRLTKPGDEGQAAARTAIPLGRFGRKEEIAAAACYLASDDAAYITGTILDVDGGMLVAGSSRT